MTEVDANRMFKLLDDLRIQMAKLCERVTKMETQYNAHIKDLVDKQTESDRSAEKKERILTFILGGIAIVEFIYLVYSGMI